MIVLRSYRVLFTKDGQPRLTNTKAVTKWQNDHDFGFDIFNPKNWKIFLSTYKMSNGKLLPTKTSGGDLILYDVLVYGISVWMKDAIRDEIKATLGGSALVYLFPGYKKDGTQRKTIDFGYIR